MEEEKIEELIIKTCKELYKKDRYLIEKNICERTIVFRFGIYMQEFMNKDNSFKNYDLDIEYNKNLDERKSTSNNPNGRYVDLIIHKRGYNYSNLLCIEFKKKIISKVDRTKIDELMSPMEVYQYKYGATITFKTDRVIYFIKSYMGGWRMKELLLPQI